MQASNLPVEIVPLLAKETETFGVNWHSNHIIGMKVLLFFLEKISVWLRALIPSFWSDPVSVWVDEFFIH